MNLIILLIKGLTFCWNVNGFEFFYHNTPKVYSGHVQIIFECAVVQLFKNGTKLYTIIIMEQNAIHWNILKSSK